MDSADQSRILRCGQCNKPFDKVASLKRHGYYCRSRKGKKSSGPPRSCLPCAKSKVRCDKLAPKCSRCETKNDVCRYPQYGARNPESDNQQTRLVNSVQTAVSETSNLSENETLEIPHCQVGSCSESVDNAINVLALPNLRSEIFDWDLSNINSTDDVLFNSAQITPSADFDAYSSSRREESLLPQNFMTEVRPMTSTSIASASACIPQSLTFNFRSLSTRPKLKTGAQVTANHMARILNSYPKMMLNYDTLPPFIHPEWISGSGSQPSLEPLANCMSLFGMRSKNVKGARACSGEI